MPVDWEVFAGDYRDLRECFCVTLRTPCGKVHNLERVKLHLAEEALHEKSLFGFFSVQPLCALCLCGCFFLSKNEPQRHRAHRGCTEKSVYAHFSGKASLESNVRDKMWKPHYVLL